MTKILERHVSCEACGSTDARCNYADGHGYCFSCHKYFPADREEVDVNITYEFIPNRGLTKSSLEFYGVRTKIINGKPHSIAFPYSNGSYKVRLLDKKDFYSEGEIGKAGLFGRNKFPEGSHKYVTITEGELDAISLYQVTHSPVVSVQSSVVAARDCAIDRSYLNSFERIYLAFDGDAPGREAAKSVARLFDHNKLYQLKFNRKDANEYLQNGEEDILRNIWHNAKKYMPDTLVSSISEFKDILNSKTEIGVSYPFPTLNYMTYGIRKGEIVLITAQEGVGKTELMHTLEHHLLKETKDGVGAIFLEEPTNRHLRAIAGLELRTPIHLPDRDCGPDKTIATLEKILGVDDRLFLYRHFGSDDPEVLIDTIRFMATACACSYILFDHVTMAVSGSTGDDERKQLDYISTRLEMLVKELMFALIIVSHVNDLGQTRGSRYISKTADVRIDLDRDLLSENSLIRNTTNMIVSKNRFCGRTGPAGKLLFDPFTGSYSETQEVANDNISFKAAM
jgi:twinkle protein